MSKLTVLFTPIDAFGQINPCIGIAEQLQQRGHRIVFAIDHQWRGRVKSQGFEEEILKDDKNTNEDPSGKYHDMLTKTGMLAWRNPLEQMVKLGNIFLSSVMTRARMINSQMKTIIENIKPDVIVFDNFAAIPAIYLSGCPKVMMIPCNPLCNFNSDGKLPPPTSGYPVDDQSNWQDFNEELIKIIDLDWPVYNKWMTSFGLPELPPFKFIYDADLHVYSYPEELDYEGINGWQRPDNWMRFDSFMRKGKDKFELPEKLKKQTRKLIFMSMGSIGSIDINLNKRFLEMLADSGYRVIIAKGPLADQYEVPDNAWGQAMLPQTQVLPLVDLVITHGGNNSLCEVFYFGKPMIIMPLFYDQFDNGQRVVETGLGICLDPFQCSKQELLGAIDKLLNDQKLNDRLKKILKRAQEEVKTARVAKVIEKLVEKMK